MSNPVLIRCLVHGNTLARTFEVQVQESDGVTRLKKLIKNEKSQTFKDIDADELELYKVDIQIGEDEDSPQAPALETQARLRVKGRLMDQLPTDLEDNHIYIMVKRPGLPKGTKLQDEEAAGLIVISDSRMNEIYRNWLQNKINLLRSPPSSGKTTLAKALEKRLTADGKVVKYITLAHWDRIKFPDLLQNNGTFNAFWKKQTQLTWSECAEYPGPIFLLVDEAQMLYQGWRTLQFWASLKDHIDNPEKSELHVLLLSMYEARRPGNTERDDYTPTDFTDAMGLDELRLTKSEFKQLIRNFIAYTSGGDEPFIMLDDMIDSVYNSTGGHPHLLRKTLEYLRGQYRRGLRDDKFRLSMVSYDYWIEIKRTRVFDWIENWEPTATDTIFLQLAYDSIDDDSTFAIDTNSEEMQKALHRLTRSGLVTYSGRSRLQFAAPVIRVIMGQRLYTSRLHLGTSSGDFEAFLSTSIERMRPSKLRQSLSRGTGRLYERAWQSEWMMAASSVIPVGHTISPDVGKLFGSSGFLDFYVNGGLNWGVEMMSEGRKKSEHVARFTQTGTYRQIPFSEWAIIDFRHNSMVLNPKCSDDHVWFALYENDYSTITIIRYGKAKIVLTLRGDDPNLFPH